MIYFINEFTEKDKNFLFTSIYSKNRKMLQQLLLNGIIAGSIYALIAIGFTVIYHTVKFFHFAKARVYTSCAFYCLFYRIFGSHIFIIALISNVFAGLLGSGIEAVVYDLLEKESLTYSAAVNVVDDDYFAIE